MLAHTSRWPGFWCQVRRWWRGKLRRLVEAIDEIVAGQLWIQICEHDPIDDRYVAKKILNRVEREAKG